MCLDSSFETAVKAPVAPVGGIGPGTLGASPRELLEARTAAPAAFYGIVETDSGEPVTLPQASLSKAVLVDTGEENVIAFKSRRSAQRVMRDLRDMMNDGVSEFSGEFVQASELRVVPVHGDRVPFAVLG